VILEVREHEQEGRLLGSFEPPKPDPEPSERRAAPAMGRPATSGEAGTPPMSMNEAKLDAEKQVLLDALARCRYHRTKAATSLDISYRTLLRRMKKHNIEI
jgi:DNA-binding NtrC family response regulator